MRVTRIVTLAGVAMALWLGAARPLPAAARQESPDREKAERRAPHSNDTIDAAIEKLIQGKASLDDVKIETQWRRKTGMISVRIYGNGVGIWRDTTQFSLSREQVRGLLRALEQARFGTMPKQYGGDDEGEDEKARESEKEKPKEKTYFLGIINLRIGADSKSVAQTMTGEQSAAFRKLGEKILAVAEKAARSGGATAKSMSDALDQLAAERLAPETLQVLAHRRTDRPGTGDEDGDWILRMDGRRVVDRSGADEKTAVVRVLVLSSEDFRAFAETLRANDPADFPRNVYSLQYLRLDVRVLSDRRDIAARRYAGTNAETHGDKQKAFDRVYAALLALHQRVAKEGVVLPANAE